MFICAEGWSAAVYVTPNTSLKRIRQSVKKQTKINTDKPVAMKRSKEKTPDG